MNRIQVFVAALLCLVGFLGYRETRLHQLAAAPAVEVAVAYDPAEVGERAGIQLAWDSYLRERRISYSWVSVNDLALLGPDTLHSRFDAIVFPDGISQWVPEALAADVERFVSAGGTLVVVNDAGTRREDGPFLTRSAFGPILNVEYDRYDALKDMALVHRPLRFASPKTARLWHVPAAKLDRSLYLRANNRATIVYPVTATIATGPLQVEAWAGENPALTYRTVGRGNAFYVGLPLGFLRATSDTLPMSGTLRRTVTDVAALARRSL